jgi:hypothetical protein
MNKVMALTEYGPDVGYDYNTTAGKQWLHDFTSSLAARLQAEGLLSGDWSVQFFCWFLCDYNASYGVWLHNGDPTDSANWGPAARPLKRFRMLIDPESAVIL